DPVHIRVEPSTGRSSESLALRGNARFFSAIDLVIVDNDRSRLHSFTSIVANNQLLLPYPVAFKVLGCRSSPSFPTRTADGGGHAGPGFGEGGLGGPLAGGSGGDVRGVLPPAAAPGLRRPDQWAAGGPAPPAWRVAGEGRDPLGFRRSGPRHLDRDGGQTRAGRAHQRESGAEQAGCGASPDRPGRFRGIPPAGG